MDNAVSSTLHSPFSDQSHLQFYGYGSGCLTPSQLCFNIPRRAFPSVSFKPVMLPLQALSDSACMALTSEQALVKEIADLKLQMKQKKKELKSRMKDEKQKLKMQIKEGKKMKKQKGVQEGKMKAKCQSESSSSSSESSDEECMHVNMKVLRQGQFVDEDAKVDIERGLVSGNQTSNRTSVAVIDCASDAVDCCHGFSSISPPMPSTSSFNSRMMIQKAASGFEEVRKHTSTCGMMSTCKSMSDSQSGFTSNACRLSNRIEVCAGGKCKKAGSEELLLALGGQIPRSLNVEAVPCKCMGKCSMGINVRVHKEDTNPQYNSHVGVEDASLILCHHFGLGRASRELPSLAPKGDVRAPLPLVSA